MKIDYLTPNKEILTELGLRLARIRKQYGYSQTKLAEEAGIGVATLRRIESGQDSQMESWLKLMKTLRMAGLIDSMMPENFRSPMAEALSAKKRKRVKNVESSKPVWGDEQS